MNEGLLVHSRDLKFYLLRLKNVSPGELLYRFRQALLPLYVKKKKRFLVQQIPAIHPKDIEDIALPQLSLNVDQAITKRILEGATFYLNDDKKTNGACETLMGNGPRFDIRSVWEPARLQHLLILLLYNKHHQDEQIADFIKNQIIRWIDSNPFPYGPNYMSAMECGLRIPVFLHALKLLKNLDLEDFRRIAEAIYIHAWWISKKLSLFSSLGNHTLAECTGLVFAGVIFRNTSEGKNWLKTSVALLKQEADHQILADGGPAEQSINYHRFVLDMYWYCRDFMKKNNDMNMDSLTPRLSAGEFFLNSMQTGQADLPALGDSDDGYAVAPGCVPHRIQPDIAVVKFQSFPEAGYSVLRTKNSTQLIFDHGPLGMAPLFNHGHADALSIILCKGGLPFLVDPGTYRYNGNPEYRRYFKSTRAHNTVTVDKVDQAVQETGFVWSHAYSSRLIRSRDDKNGYLIEAAHDGYARLAKKVRHSRTILSDHNLFIIRDKFDGIGQHEFELNYHLHPDAAVECDDGWWRIQRGQMDVYLSLLKGDVLTSFFGQENPILGWFSPSYGIKRECWVLQCKKKNEAHCAEFVTAICTGDILRRSELEVMVCCRM